MLQNDTSKFIRIPLRRGQLSSDIMPDPRVTVTIRTDTLHNPRSGLRALTQEAIYRLGKEADERLWDEFDAMFADSFERFPPLPRRDDPPEPPRFNCRGGVVTDGA